MVGGLLELGNTASKMPNPLKAVRMCGTSFREESLLLSQSPKLRAQGVNWYEANLLFDAFVDGARVEEYMPDFPTCKEKMFYGWLDYVYVAGFFNGEDANFQPDFYNSIYNITATIGELGTWIDSCYETQ